MKKIKFILSLLILLSITLTSCAPSLSELPSDEPESTPQVTTTKKENKNDKTNTNEKEEKEIMQKEDPKSDNKINILMIGNSYCYYYVEELYGMAKTVGVDLNIYNLYASGAELREHWTWHTNKANECELYQTNENGRKKISSGITLTNTLKKENWDIISFQEGGRVYRTGGIDGLRGEKVYLEKLLGYVKEQFPMTKYYWHCSWVPQVGYSNESQGFYINTKEDEVTYQQAKITVSKEIRDEFNLPIIPSGAAWLDARYNPVINNQLCLRKGNPDDLSHDGDIGGGQYLNACVWFEVLTGKSCVGNSWRPDYELSEAKIAVLQAAAHKAVSQYK
ncbi:MAG: DUF4886 domain-containing protein [Clostridia bacterium]|nr:DUF4886 domain-containing protein [Clostridia bacterium]